MSTKAHARLVKAAFEAVHLIRAYATTADGTGQRVLASLANLADRLRVWGIAAAGGDGGEAVLGTLAAFDGLAEELVDVHASEGRVQQRGLGVVLEALAAHQEAAFALKREAGELRRIASAGGTLDSRSVTAPLSASDLAELVGGLAGLIAADLLQRVALASAAQDVVLPAADGEAAAAVLAEWSTAWDTLDLARRSSVSGDPASPLSRLSDLTWQLSGAPLATWLGAGDGLT
jgi:hypothetical protein